MVAVGILPCLMIILAYVRSPVLRTHIVLVRGLVTRPRGVPCGVYLGHWRSWFSWMTTGRFHLRTWYDIAPRRYGTTQHVAILAAASGDFTRCELLGFALGQASCLK